MFSVCVVVCSVFLCSCIILKVVWLCVGRLLRVVYMCCSVLCVISVVFGVGLGDGMLKLLFFFV